MSKLATALMFGCAILLASDASFARARIRMSTPPSKPAAVQPSKPATMQPSTVRPSKPATSQAARPSKPADSAASRSGGLYLNVNVRPFAAGRAAAPASAQRAMPDSADYAGRSGSDRAPAMTEEKRRAPMESMAAATEPTPAQPAATELAKAEPAPAPVRVALPSMHAATGQSGPAPAAMVCYVQPSGACVPF